MTATHFCQSKSSIWQRIESSVQCSGGDRECDGDWEFAFGWSFWFYLFWICTCETTVLVVLLRFINRRLFLTGLHTINDHLTSTTKQFWSNILLSQHQKSFEFIIASPLTKGQWVRTPVVHPVVRRPRASQMHPSMTVWLRVIQRYV